MSPFHGLHRIGVILLVIGVAGCPAPGTPDAGTVKASASPKPKSTASASPKASATPTSSPSPSPSATATPTPSPSPSATPTVGPTASPTPSATPTPTPKPSPTTTATPIPAVTTLPLAGKITITDNAFSPATLTVKKGAFIVFDNQGAAAHTATSTSVPLSIPQTGRLVSGTASLSIQFNTVGSFPYKCDYHPEMTGTIIVEN